MADLPWRPAGHHLRPLRIDALVVSSNGSEFLVLRGESTADSENLFLQRVAKDDGVAARESVEITTIAAGTPFGLAGTEGTIATGYYTEIDSGENCIRVTRK